MSPAGRQVDLILLLFILLHVPTVSAAFRLTSFFSDSHNLVDQALRDLVSGPLRGQDLLLVTDDYSEDLLDIGWVVATAGTSTTPVLLTTQHSLLHTPRPAHHTKGTQLTALLLFHSDPTTFLHRLADNKHWNPNYLVLFCLDPHLNTTVILSLPVVQRSQFILLLQSAVRGSIPRLNAYTSRPFQYGDQNRQLIKAPLGVWDFQTFHHRQLLFPPRFMDFGGKILTISTICIDNPFLFMTEDNQCVGMHVDALNMIGQLLNFTLNFMHRESVIWGIKINGTWRGMLGDVMDGLADFALNTLIVTPDRISDFDWTYPHWQFGFGILSKVPPPMPRWKNVMYPFSTQMWLLILVTTIGTSTALSIILYSFHYITDPVGFILKVCSSVVSQPMPDREVVAWWARVWLIVWWVSVDILAAAYMSNLMAVLTLPVFPYRIQTVEELAQSDLMYERTLTVSLKLFETQLYTSLFILLEQWKYYLGPSMVDYGSMVPDALQTSKNPSLATLGRKLYLDPETNNDDPFGKLMDKVMNENYAIIENYYYITYVQNWKKLTEETYLYDEQLYKSYLSWWLPPHTPYSPAISRYLTQLLETGVLAKLFTVNLESYITRQTSGTKTGGGQVLTLGHLQAAFILLLIGFLTATLALGLELVIFTEAFM